VQTGFKTPQDIYDRLMCFDQLLAERAKGTVLRVRHLRLCIDSISSFFYQISNFGCGQGFDEGHLLFKPSYKFDPFTEVYDTGTIWPVVIRVWNCNMT
jgi:hypothetical protein